MTDPSTSSSLPLLELVQVGDPVEHRGVVVWPLFPRRQPVCAYVTLEDALSRGLAIREVSETGAVPELQVSNPLDERVLLYDGEELVGAKQNRILNLSVLVPERTTLPIPVSCVEQGQVEPRLRGVRAGGARGRAGAAATQARPARRCAARARCRAG